MADGGNAASLDVVINATDNASDVLSNVAGNIENVSSAGNSAVERAVQAGERWKTAGKNIKEFGEGVDAVTKPLQYAAVGTVVAGTAAAKAAMDYETAFAGVKKTVDGTPEQLAAVSKEIKQMSTEIPVSAAELANLAAAAGQLGVGVEDIGKFTKTAAAMNVATNLTGEEGAASLAKFVNVTGESLDNVDRIGSAVVELGNNTATTEADIMSMAVRMGKFANTVHISADEVLGYSAALSSAGVEAQLGGSSIGRIWLDISSSVAKGGEGLKAYAKYAGKSADEFAKQWSTDPSGAFNGLIKGLSAAENLTVAMNDLGIGNVQDQQAIQALANNYELLERCMTLSSDAYRENTALIKEADAAYSTTASKLNIVKNEVTNAAAAWGEVLLPEVSAAAQWVGNAAKKFGELDTGQKKAVLSAGKTVVATGLVAKAAAGGIKYVGSFAEGLGNIITHAPQLAAGLAKVAKVAGPVAISVACIIAAVEVGKAAYDAWYKSQYRWSEGLSEGNEKVKKSLDSYKKISDIQREVKNLKLIIENPDSSAEQVENAKQRLEEIKQLLSKEYNLVIKTDNSNLDSTLDNLKKLEKNELQDNINSQKNKLANLLPNLERYDAQKEDLEKQINSLRETQARYREFRIEAAALDKESSDYEQAMFDLIEEYEIPNDMPIAALIDNAGSVVESIEKEIGDQGNLPGKLKSLISAKEEVTAITTELANWETEMISIAAQGGDTAGIQQALEDMKGFINIGELDMEGYAQAAALAMNGIDSLEAAWSRAANGDGQALDGVVKDYIRSMQEFGASAQETATGAALIQNGFRTISEAAAAGKLDTVIEQANQLAHAMGLLPQSASIEISADGDISVIHDTEAAVEQLNSTGSIKLQINAEGNYDVLDTADKKLEELATNNEVTIKFNTDTGVFDILDNFSGKELGNISVDGTVTWANNTLQPDEYKPEPKESDVVYAPEHSLVDKWEPPLKNGTVVYEAVLSNGGTVAPASSRGELPSPGGGSVAKKAQGTQNFEGGLAMVNDQRGIPDPRELIVDKGRAFIPAGKDVILPLSKGAKVYTAAQTKAIMSGLGIPRYAAGKDNSDAFTNARDDWSHYTKTHAITNTQELEKWNKLLKESAQNAKDVADAEEMIYAAQLKVNKELDEASEKYIKNRAFHNDWEAYGDDPAAAFERYRERQNNLAAASEQTWQEAGEKIHDFGEDLFTGRVDQSLKWLEHERKYNDMSTEDYIASLQRIQDYTKAYYDQGIIDLEKCRASMTEIDEKYLDSVKEMQEEIKTANDETYRAWEKSMNNWVKIHDTYGDWDKIGDSLSQVYARSIKQQDAFLKQGVIDWQTAQDNKLEYALEMYSAVSDEYDEMLRKQSDEISKLREKFSAEESALRTGWDVSDRAADLDEVNKLLGLYKNAVTDGGQQKYKDLLKQKEQLDRDERLYQLQVENNAVLDKMQAEYDLMEENKKNVLGKLKLYGREAADCAADIARVSEDTYSMAREIGLEYASMSDVTHSYLADMCSLLGGIQRALSSGKNVYNDNRQINIRESEQIAGTYVTNADIVYALSK